MDRFKLNGHGIGSLLIAKAWKCELSLIEFDGETCLNYEIKGQLPLSDEGLASCEGREFLSDLIAMFLHSRRGDN